MKKVCCIGDIHGTEKFLKCYDDILKNDNDCDYIIVFGDHFDPYEDISLDVMIDRYKKFDEIRKNDSRIISLLGNHDLAHYVIYGDETNRTYRYGGSAQKISDCIVPNLPESYLCFRIGDYLFSHAGVSEDWLEYLDKVSPLDDDRKVIRNYREMIFNNHKGWTSGDLSQIVRFSYHDWSGYGNHETQGCTWIRPGCLIGCAVRGYNQVVAHTIFDKITSRQMLNGKTLWLIDTGGKPNYLTLEIDENIKVEE